MKKKFNHYVSLSLLLLSVLPFSLVSAETVEEVPTGETTISSMAEDPLKELKEKAANQVPTIESTPESESVEDTPTNESETKEDVPKTEDMTESKPKPQARGGGIGPQAVNLIEGVDIDADFAQLLRTGASHPSWMYGVTNAGFTGYGKAPNTLTDDDMKTLTYLNAHGKQLNGIKGIEHAVNLEELSCGYNKFNNLDLSQNTKLKKVTSSGNTPLASIDITNCVDLLELEVRNNQFTNIDLSKNIKLEKLILQGPNLTSLDLSKNIELKTLELGLLLSTLDITNNPKLTSVSAIVTGASLDLTSNTKLEFLQLRSSSVEHLDFTPNIELKRLEYQSGKLKTIDVSKSTKLNYIDVSANQLTSLDLTNNSELTYANCSYNELTDLKLGSHPKLTTLSCGANKLTTIDVSGAAKLREFRCGQNQLSSLDVDNNTELFWLYCEFNDLQSLDVSKNLILNALSCNDNKLVNLDFTGLKELRSANCQNNLLETVVLNGNDKLEGLNCNNNRLTNLNITSANQLVTLMISQNKITTFSASGHPALQNLYCNENQLTNLDVTNVANLRILSSNNNKLPAIDLSSTPSLQNVDLSYNELEAIDVTANTNLTKLDCRYNHISDITKAYNSSFLKGSDIRYQTIFVPVPSVNNNQATLDKLKTTAHLGLNVSNIDITGSPVLTPNGDKIELSNVTRDSLTNKSLSFNYNSSQISAGQFGGTIKFFTVSELFNELRPSPRKVKSGDLIQWTWNIQSITTKDAENIHATLTLPSGLTLQPGSILVDGVAGTISDIDGTNNLGDLSQNQSIVIKFATKAVGNADEWLEAKGTLDWEDDTINSPHTNQSTGEIQLLDEEQTYTPTNQSMGILSVPIYFNYGVKNQKITAQTFGLASSDYQSNTNVVTDGFYTRIKDDRAISTGWKLTAKLSDFLDSSNQPMPNGTGTMLKLENMSIERVTDRDTPQEVIDPTPSGLDVPSSVQATETLVAGQSTAKTIVSAQPNEGQDTWQLRMPFDKVSLSVPANAGKKGTVYKANLTWSLDDTP